MGFMTEIGILNDRFDEIEKDPERFVRDIKQGMNRSRGERDYFIGQTTVHPSHHADEPRVYLAHRNGFYNLGEYGIEDALVESGHPVDARLDFYEDEIDKAMKMLKNAKKYVRYLRDEVGYDERPGGPDHSFFNDHHAKAHRPKRKS